MPKKRRFKNMDAQGRRITEPYVKLTRNLLTSPAWNYASTGARCIYIAIRQRFNGNNNGEISFSCREGATVIRGSKSTASKHLIELAEHGLIKPNEVGLFTYKHATTWILTNEGFNNQPPTHEWKQWTPPQKQNEVPVDGQGVPPSER